MTTPASAKPPANLNERRSKTRKALIDGGLRLLAARPIDAIAIDDIVQEAGVAKGSFYNHFDDKDDLARAIAGEVRQSVEAVVGEVNQGVEDPAKRVARAVCVYIRQAVADPLRTSALLRIHSHGAYASAPMNRGVLADVSQGLLTGRFVVQTAEAGVLFILGVAQSALARAHDEPNPTVTTALGQQLCSLLLRGLGLPAAEADSVAAQAAHEVLRPIS